MLKKNDEKINGFLLVIEYPFLLSAESYFRAESFLCIAHRPKKNNRSA